MLLLLLFICYLYLILKLKYEDLHDNTFKFTTTRPIFDIFAKLAKHRIFYIYAKLKDAVVLRVRIHYDFGLARHVSVLSLMFSSLVFVLFTMCIYCKPLVSAEPDWKIQALW